MKILHLISSSGMFGAERVVFALAREHSKRGMSVCVGMLRNEYNPHLELIDEAEKHNLRTKIFYCRRQFDSACIKAMRKFITEKKFDIIHSHGYKSNFYALSATLFLNVKRISTCHNWLSINTKMKLYERMDKMLLKKFDTIVVVSDILFDDVIKSGISREKARVIHNGIDVERFSPQTSVNSPQNSLRQEFGFGQDDKVIGVIARLAQDKGHEYLLEAFASLVTMSSGHQVTSQDVTRVTGDGCTGDQSRLKLLIVGDGPLRQQLTDSVKRLGLEKNVVFAGVRSDIPEVLNAIDVFVLPSSKEGLPISLLEAMAAKKPIIATRVGAIPNVIEDGTSGILIEPYDVRALSDAILDILGNQEKASRFVSSAYKKVCDEFSSQRMAQEYEQIYLKQ